MPSHYKGRPEIKRALSAYINFARAANIVNTRLEAQIESSGMTLGQFAVLEVLYHLGSMHQCTLAQKLLRSGGNVTVVIDNLEKRGWVLRERLKRDRRMVTIHLTPAGRRLIAKVFPEHARAIAAEMNRLSPADQETLRALCRTLGKSAKENKEIDKVPSGTQEEHHA